jgi:hypothetical protein
MDFVLGIGRGPICSSTNIPWAVLGWFGNVLSQDQANAETRQLCSTVIEEQGFIQLTKESVNSA